jgi:NAD(P)-dependent dehydrogenase (short-subunit alcohol dehydrogenase family)
LALTEKAEKRPLNVIVCGASSGIGLALTQQILSLPQVGQVWAGARHISDGHPLLDLKVKHPLLSLFPLEATQESDFASLGQLVEPHGVDWVINCIGLLHDQEGLSPERKIEELDMNSHLKVYQVNCLPTLLLAKHLKKHLRNSQQPRFVAVSAKVGSISDNKMGGWYSYRISKAALNMAIKNLSIEFQRLNKQMVVAAIHPGTTKTKLSEPFMAGAQKKYEIHNPEDTARNLLKVIQQFTEADNGGFYSWDGSPLPW